MPSSDAFGSALGGGAPRDIGLYHITVSRIALPGAFRIYGVEYEIEEAMRCVSGGLVESARLPLDEALAVVELIDATRDRIDVRYPFEVSPT